MSIKGYLVFVPAGNVAAYEFGGTSTVPGSATRPDKAVIATTPGHLAGPFEVRQVVDDCDALAALAARSQLGLPPDGAVARDLRPARLSADLTMSDGRTVHVPRVPVPAEPATAGRVKVCIPYPVSEPRGFVTAVKVASEELGVTFRGHFDPDLPPVSIEPGDTLTVPFGEESLDAGDIARVFGERP